MVEEKNEVEFKLFISGLLAEGLAALGVLKHPAAAHIQKDLRHASLVIDTLDMLKEKTSGNLTEEESKTMEEVLHQLRMGYVATLKESPESGSEGAQEEKKEDK